MECKLDFIRAFFLWYPLLFVGATNFDVELQPNEIYIGVLWNKALGVWRQWPITIILLTFMAIGYVRCCLLNGRVCRPQPIHSALYIQCSSMATGNSCFSLNMTNWVWTKCANSFRSALCLLARCRLAPFAGDAAIQLVEVISGRFSILC